MKKINLMPSDFWNSSSFAKTLLMYQYLILTFDVKTISLLFPELHDQPEQPVLLHVQVWLIPP